MRRHNSCKILKISHFFPRIFELLALYFSGENVEVLLSIYSFNRILFVMSVV